MGAAESKGNAVAPSKEGQKLDKILGKDRPAVGRNQVQKATMQQLSDDLLKMAKDLDTAVHLAQEVAGHYGDKNVYQSRFVDCIATPLTAPQNTWVGSAPAVAPSGQRKKPGWNNAASPTSARERRQQKRKSSARAAKVALANTAQNWRLRIADAKRNAAYAFQVTRALMKMSGKTAREDAETYLDSLSPIMTDDMGANGQRFAAAFNELLDIVGASGCATSNTISKDQAQRVVETSKLLQVFVNNTNASHLLPAPWSLPVILKVEDWKEVQGGDQYLMYASRALDLFKTGRIAIHINCAGEGLHSSMFDSTSDPYELAKSWNVSLPVGATAGRRIRGLPVAQRQLTALACAAERLLGPELMRRVHVVLTLNESELKTAWEDLTLKRFYGFDKERVLVLVQPRLPQHVWDPSAKMWIPDPARPPRTAGTGYAIKQLAFFGECCGFAGKPASRRMSQAHLAAEAPMEGSKVLYPSASCLSLLRSRGVTWMHSFKCGDLGLFDPAMALDVDAIAFTLRAFDKSAARCTVQVVPTASAFDGAVARVPKLRSGRALTATQCVALPPLNCNTPEMAQALADLQVAGRGEVFAPTERWTFHLEALSTALGGEPGALPAFHWKPSMLVAKEGPTNGMHPILNTGDLTIAGELPCCAFMSGAGMVQLVSSAQGDAMLLATNLQDGVAEFQDMAMRLQPLQHLPLEMTTLGTAQQRFKVLVLVAETPNNASLTAFRYITHLLRPGMDSIHLMHVTKDLASKEAAAKVFENYKLRPDIQHMDMHTETYFSTGYAWDAVEEYALKLKPHLIVMGSEATMVGGKVIGSMAVSVAKSTSFPLLVVKADFAERVARAEAALVSGNAAAVLPRRRANMGWEQQATGYTAVLSVETGKVALEMLLTTVELLRSGRDSIVLARCAAAGGGSSNNPQATKRLLRTFEEAFMHGSDVKTTTRVLPGKGVAAVVEAAAKSKADMVIMQASHGGIHIEPEVVEAVKTSANSVLIWRHVAHSFIGDVGGGLN